MDGKIYPKAIGLIVMISIFIVGPLFSSSCVCSKWNTKFLKGAEHYDFIGRIQYLGDDHNYSDDYNEFQKFRVIHSWTNTSTSDTIAINVTNGLDCLSSFGRLSEGQELIVKLFYNESYNSQGENKILYLGICLENVMSIRNGEVIGNFTRNKYWKRAKVSKLVRVVSFGLLKLKQVDREKSKQVLSYELVSNEIAKRISGS